MLHGSSAASGASKLLRQIMLIFDRSRPRAAFPQAVGPGKEKGKEEEEEEGRKLEQVGRKRGEMRC